MDPDPGPQRSWVVSLLADTNYLPQYHTKVLIYLASKQHYCHWSLEASWRSGVACLVTEAGRVGPRWIGGWGSVRCLMWLHDCYMTLEGVKALLHTNICICYTAQSLFLLLLWCCQVELQTDVGPGWMNFLMSESNVDWVLLWYHLQSNKDNCWKFVRGVFALSTRLLQSYH